LRTHLVIALVATLVGCSHQPPQQQVAAESCRDKDGAACFNGTAANQLIELPSFKTNSSTKEIKVTKAAKTDNPPSHHARHKAHLATKKTNPTTIAAKAKERATRIPLPRASVRTQHDPKSNAGAGSGTIGSNIAASHPIVGAAANSNYKTTQEAVAVATGVAERMTVASASAARNDGEPIGGTSTNKTDNLVAVVLVRPEVGSVSDLTGKDIAIDERYSTSSADVRIAIVAAGGPVVQLSSGRATAIDRLVNGEVPAAVVVLVSADAADGFPEITGFKIFRIPLSPRSLRARP
jgi:hypothetical protein